MLVQKASQPMTPAVARNTLIDAVNDAGWRISAATRSPHRPSVATTPAAMMS